MSARVGSKERLAEVRADERRRHSARTRVAWRLINRTTASFNADVALAAHVDQLRSLDVLGLAHEAERLDVLPGSPLVAELRLEVEIEQAGRRWRATVREAERDGWETVIARQRRSIVAGVA